MRKMPHRFLRLFGVLTAIVLSLGACQSLPKDSPYPTRKIPVMAGPEDMVLDRWENVDRILVSCYDRRTEDSTARGAIVAYNLATEETFEMERRGEPDGLDFQPHGIDRHVIGKQSHLFVISHTADPHQHFIYEYRIEADHLQFIRNHSSELFRSPNDVFVDEEGNMYVSNDRYDSGTMKEAILKQKKASVVKESPDGTVSMVCEDLGFANGLFIKDGYLYVGATRDNKVWRYPLEGNGEREMVNKMTGPDNIMAYEDKMYVVAHPKPVAFIRHAKKQKNHSPVVVWEVVEGEKKGKAIFVDRGDRINAGATAIRVGDKMYISQVFEPYLLEVDLSE